jgi:hypothetical protein
VGIAQHRRAYCNTVTLCSWTAETVICGGRCPPYVLYMSEAYARLKTVSILIHKDSLPENLRVQ